MSSTRNGSLAKRGSGDWKSSLQLVTSPLTSIKVLESDELTSHLSLVDGNEEKIVKVWLWKNNLKRLIPKWFGAWHEFTVVQAENWWWSFEKNSEGLCVQRGKTESSVKEYIYDDKRTGSIDAEGRNPQTGHDGDQIISIFQWIQSEGMLNREYHVTGSNCHYFASQVFEAIARQKGRTLL